MSWRKRKRMKRRRVQLSKIHLLATTLPLLLRQATTKTKLQMRTDVCQSKGRQCLRKYQTTLRQWSSSKKSHSNNWTGILPLLCLERTKLWVHLSMILSIIYCTNGHEFLNLKRVRRHQIVVGILHRHKAGKTPPRTPAGSPPTSKAMRILRILSSSGRRTLEDAT